MLSLPGLRHDTGGADAGEAGRSVRGCEAGARAHYWAQPGRALACAIATFLLLVPANLLPFLTVYVAGVAITTRLASVCATIWTQGRG